MAGEFNIPLIMMNISDLKGSLVGQSTQQLKAALKMILAVGRPIIMATCNKEEALSPELRDRFKLGTYFFEMPTTEEKKAVWNIWMQKYKLKDYDLPEDEGWTQRNIHDCCNLAWRVRKSLEEVAGFIVPLGKSDPKGIAERRRMADGRYLSANQPGIYKAVQPQQFKDDDEVRVISKIGEA
jgi:hypothetical protein